MKFRLHLINWNLAAALALTGLLPGCASISKKDEEISTIRLHFEVNPQMVRRSIEISVLRAQPVKLTVAEEPLVHEGYLNDAEIVNDGSSHRLRLQFDDAGRRLLETETAANQGRRIAIAAQFPDLRWLAAPVVTRTITNGAISFTPDADLEECRRLVDGLKLVIAKRKKESWLE